MKTISIHDFYILYQNNDSLNIIDIRNKQDFNDYHIEGTINIPSVEFFSKNFSKLDKNKTYYIIDYNDEVSEDICNRLTALGFNAINIFGGIKRWKGNFV